MSARSRQHWIAFAIVAGLTAFAWFGPTGLRDARMWAHNCEQLPLVQERIRSDATFADVKAGVCSAGGILVAGTVASQRDVARLQSLLEPIAVWGGIHYIVRTR